MTERAQHKLTLAQLPAYLVSHYSPPVTLVAFKTSVELLVCASVAKSAVQIIAGIHYQMTDLRTNLSFSSEGFTLPTWKGHRFAKRKNAAHWCHRHALLFKSDHVQRGWYDKDSAVHCFSEKIKTGRC